MKNTKNIHIDGNRLIAALRLKNLTLNEASLEMGRSNGYLTNCIRVGYINPATEKMIEKMFDIPLGMYIPTHPEDVEDEPVVAENEVGIDYERLQEAIYCAIIGAIRKLQREGVIPGGDE